jgi:glycosyltransferase involved in cell wall biosynthesis
MSESSTFSGQRVLLVGEYIGMGGTRTYFEDLLRFYHRHGALVTAVTTYLHHDPDMQSLAESLGFRLWRINDAVAMVDPEGPPWRPHVWSLRSYREESRMFNRLGALLDADRVTISVGTSGLLLSAMHAAPSRLMIAHGYPHGLRQRLLGQQFHARLLPENMPIVTVSDFSGNQFKHVWKTAERGITVTTVRSTCGPLVDSADLRSRTPLVLTAALLEAYKEPFDWLEIAKQTLGVADEAEFMWIGDGSMRADLIAATHARGISRVSFPGWDASPDHLYRRARVYLQTSSNESLGLSVLDALRHGLPCVVTDAGGLPEVVQDGVNGYVVPVGDVQAAARALQRLLADDELWRRQSQASQQIYRDRFDPDVWDGSILRAHLEERRQ